MSGNTMVHGPKFHKGQSVRYIDSEIKRMKKSIYGENNEHAHRAVGPFPFGKLIITEIPQLNPTTQEWAYEYEYDQVLGNHEGYAYESQLKEYIN